MKMIEIDKLIEWLGPDGAIVGLEESNLTVSELFELASHHGLAVEKKMRRSDIINELVNRNFVTVDKATEELLAMDHERLKKYLVQKRTSRTELLSLLSQFDIQPGSEARKTLLDFVAREISDLGMYQRVAKGKQRR